MSTVFDRGLQILRRPHAFYGISLFASASQAPNRAPTIDAGSGVPTKVEPDGSLYLRIDGASVNEVLYVSRGGSWDPVEANSSGSTFTDGSSWYTTDTLQGLADAVVAAVGGTSQGVRAYTEDNVLTDDQTIVASLDALDLKWGDLASVANGEGASLVGFENPSSHLGAAATVEDALQAAGADLQDYRDQFVVATVTVPDVGSGGTDAALTLSLKQAADNSTDVGTARQVMILVIDAEAAPSAVGLNGNVTFSAATTGAIIDSGTGWCLAQTDASGDFACTAANSADETTYFRVVTAEGVSAIAERCVVVGTNSDSATWSA